MLCVPVNSLHIVHKGRFLIDRASLKSQGLSLLSGLCISILVWLLF
jgi:hypothetical protein